MLNPIKKTPKSKLNIDELNLLAKSRNGLCLSKSYTKISIKLLWQCEAMHQWETSPSVIMKGHWCPYCAGTAKLTIGKMYEIAHLKGGECLSSEYQNSKSKLVFKCQFGHIWKSVPSSIISGTWCPFCAGNIRLTIQNMHEMAKIKEGNCLSRHYINSKTKLQWECKYGHHWYATPNDIRSGKWCSVCFCSKRKGENAVRNFFELTFDCRFPSSRPNWLRFEGRRIELDGYSKSLNLAFEYQGKYHFEKSAHWYPDKSVSFERRQLIDAHKKRACLANNVILIEITELNPRNNPEEWKKKIKNSLQLSGVKIPEIFDFVPFGSAEFYLSKNYLDDAHELAKLRQGFCHSKSILYREQLVEWECDKGHQWSASLSQISLRNTWCPNCAGKLKLSIEEMRTLAISRNGLCLSSIYTNAKTKLSWQCEFGHQWEAIPLSIKRGSWCPYCGGTSKQTTHQMHEIATIRGGECLSNEYQGSKNKLLWKCRFGHIWNATPSSIKSGSWCPHCGGSLKLTITDMYEVAIKKGGACLSSQYINAKSKLLWECKYGHQWYATPDKVKNLNRWCRKCKNKTNACKF